ncbi:MAG: type IV toxin-antitoxin system AbiEi family antitoxin domain-containing protein [Solirubrobacterales bacterium]
MRPIQRLSEIAEDQWGLITRRQAQEAGVGNTSLARLAADSRLERVAHGVYRIRGAGEPDHLGLRAAWLQLAPETPAWARLGELDDAVVSHASAASLHRVGDLRADVREFTLPRRRQTRRRDVRLHRGEVPAPDRIVLSGLPVTRAARTIADLLADHVEPGVVGRIAAEVLDGGLEGTGEVAERLAAYATRFDLPRDDGEATLDHLLALAGSRGPAGTTASAI